MRFRPNTMDEAVTQDMAKDPYRIRPLVKNDNIVVDAGANIGAFADFVFKCAPRARVICIEPCERNVDLCRENLREWTDCVVIHAALAGQSGSIMLQDFGDRESAVHSVVDYGIPGEAVVKVPAITLQDLMLSQKLNSIDILKLDVQGAEFDIISSCPREVLETVMYVAMEVHPCLRGAKHGIRWLPNSHKMVHDLVKGLSKTHVLIHGFPYAEGLPTLLWKNKRAAGLLEPFLASARLVATTTSLLVWQKLGLRRITPAFLRDLVRSVARM